ncbi:heme-binding protein [Polaromonas sp.]|uniref:SOUL family heme-binding protein n=1 Tax=Polaromonas sp. TaxID=1869339 RepID=UPI0013BA45AB|nr:heme-binding protein [Polaromonas sp.]NDP61300.1 heme-binding protein [Polaromonas sp.]
MAVEEPKFDVLTQDGSYEVRRYAPVIVAETLVEGDMDAASGKGFRLIADYIFGNNTVTATGADKSSQKIAMTAPVTLEPVAGSAKIAMTAPVTAEPVAADASMATASQWRIQFVMPGQYSMQTLPKPVNTAVSLRELPARTFAVLGYSGLNTASKVQQKTGELAAWMRSRQLEPVGAPQLARYDPPWTLPMWRRNEIQVEVKNP